MKKRYFLVLLVISIFLVPQTSSSSAFNTLDSKINYLIEKANQANQIYIVEAIRYFNLNYMDIIVVEVISPIQFLSIQATYYFQIINNQITKSAYTTNPSFRIRLNEATIDDIISNYDKTDSMIMFVFYLRGLCDNGKITINPTPKVEFLFNIIIILSALSLGIAVWLYDELGFLERRKLKTSPSNKS